MRITGHIALVGSGQMGFGLSHPLDCHVYLVHDGDEAVIIDAGAGLDTGSILEQIDQTKIPQGAIGRLLLTHAHPDHAGGARALHDALGVEVHASPLAAQAVRDGDERASGLDRLREPGGYPESYALAPCPVAGELREGERIAVGRLAIEVIETPGHCGGHLSFALHRPGGIDLFGGDAVFAGGRILLQALPDCSVIDACESVRRLFELRADGLFPGHGMVALREGWTHPYAAMEWVSRQLPPPQLV